MGTVGTSSTATATAYGNQKKTVLLSNGVRWDFYASTGASIAGAYTTDGGVTHSNAITVYTGGSFVFTHNLSAVADPGDYIHIAFKDPTDGFIKYMRGTPTNSERTAYTWSAAFSLTGTDARGDVPDLVAHRDVSSSGWRVHVVFAYFGNGQPGIATYVPVSISAGGASTVGQSVNLSPSYSAAPNTYPSIDFRHTGDGKTVAGGQPDLFVGWSAGQAGSGFGIRFRKATYASGSWTWGAEREIDNTRYLDDGNSRWLTCHFDGSRVVLAGHLVDAGGNIDVILHDRDATDPAAGGTTARTLIDNTTSLTRLSSGTSSYDAAGNVYLFGENTDTNPGSRQLAWQKWDRATGALGARQIIDSTGNASPFTSARRSFSGNAIDYVYTDGTASPYTVTSGRIVLNTAPTAATPTTPAAGSGVDRTQPITLAWVFNDSDAGDSQSKSDIRYKLTSASTWTTILGATTTATSYALPANQAAGNYEWQVLTYDALGVASPWSASSFFTAGDPPGVPVITSPSVGGTVSNTHTVTWSSPQQDAYEVRRVADNAASPSTGTVYFTTETVEDATSRARTLAFETNNRTEHVQVRVRYSGIWSQWASARVLVSYTPPATPTVVLTVQDATASILVSITNPTPSGSQPTVASHDILIDDGFGEGFTRRATGWAPGAAYTYWLPVSGRAYEGNIRVVAVATNSTTSTGVAT